MSKETASSDKKALGSTSPEIHNKQINVKYQRQRTYDLNVAQDSKRLEFYTTVLQALQKHNIPFLLGGAYAYECYTGVHRDTKDLDVFVLPNDIERVLQVLGAPPYNFITELAFEYWLGKVKSDNGIDFVDFIFNSANGVCPVSQDWFDRAIVETVPFVDNSKSAGLESTRLKVKLVPVEEMIWQKAFIMEKERFDGNDVTHLILKCGGCFTERRDNDSDALHDTRNLECRYKLDWEKLVNLFGRYWRVLYTHLVLFGFVYPMDQNKCVPAWVYRYMMNQMEQDTGVSSSAVTSMLMSPTPSTSSSGFTSTVTTTSTTKIKNQQLVEQSSCVVERQYVNNNNNSKTTEVEVQQQDCSGAANDDEAKECRGTLLSRAQYLTDIFKWGYQDTRRKQDHMTDEQISKWTRSIQEMHVADAALISSYFELQ